MKTTPSHKTLLQWQSALSDDDDLMAVSDYFSSDESLAVMQLNDHDDA